MLCSRLAFSSGSCFTLAMVSAASAAVLTKVKVKLRVIVRVKMRAKDKTQVDSTAKADRMIMKQPVTVTKRILIKKVTQQLKILKPCRHSRLRQKVSNRRPVPTRRLEKFHPAMMTMLLLVS